MSVVIKFARNHENAIIPSFKHDGDSGFDIYTIEREVILPNCRKALRTGLNVEIPIGFEMQIRPRSGISINTDLTIIKGTIDSGYRGEIRIIAHNTGTMKHVVEVGTRLAQGVICELPDIRIVEVSRDELSQTSRGEGGFNSTGLK